MNGTIYNQLIMFHAIVREGSITKAAKQLQVATPSVSNALKALESELGLPLFTRTTRSIELTEAGKMLHLSTSTSMSELSLAVESISDLTGKPSGKVRISIPRFVYLYLVKPIYAEFCRQYPDIELEISVSDATIDILKEGIDLGIRFGEKVEQGMVARALTKPMKEALFASPDYIDKHGLPVKTEDLASHKAIQYRFVASHQLAPLHLRKGQDDIHVNMPSALIVNDTGLMIDAALKGLGIGRIVQPIVEDYFASGELVPILQDHWFQYAGLYLYFHKNSQRARRVRVLIDFLLQHARSGH